ncbi:MULTISPECIES: SDR family NAD(P)-dependent oxidoreductase [unclassified Paenibacillus]|uniref:SDR family NAD(P)-dependent oxidoreductase n=1 Tax=unclassified Paenibacillus TaxID=185978 RepID=UPI0017814B0F|nr:MULTISPECIES: SDR family NAD(P)-dependent oxidoreductase [unclassified Paenibacillus]MBD8837737.1 SDR family NAD(P)-dependent oxidoreductase [Paenibacillus sp. CFBP 13594]QZN73893.1 SDR family NAD(P)-dependent oxidoreductase [Paenibacillus sp. DR312]
MRKDQMLSLDQILEMVKGRRLSSEIAYQLIQEIERHDNSASNEKNIQQNTYLYPSWEIQDLQRTVFKSERLLLFVTGEENMGQWDESASIIRVIQGNQFIEQDADTFVVRPEHEEDYERLFNRLSELQWIPDTVVHGWNGAVLSEDGGTLLSKQLAQGVYALFYTCQWLAKCADKKKIHLLYVYSSDHKEEPASEAVSSFMRSVTWEHPQWTCRTLDMGNEPIDMLQLIKQELEARDQAVEVRYWDNRRYVKRLVSLPKREYSQVDWNKEGVYLITGGMGGIGLKFASLLAKSARVIVLSGRSILSRDQEQQLHDLGKFGAEIVYIPADVSQRESAFNLIRECKARFGGIHGVIHCAGVLRDSMLQSKNKVDMDAVIAPKVYGTVWLDEASCHEQLDFFIVCSSVMSVLGNAGQCDYAFANGFMDGFCRQRDRLNKEGLRSGQTISLNWPLWSEAGMGVDPTHRLFLENTLGISAISSEHAIHAFEDAFHCKENQLVIVGGDAAKFQKVHEKTSFADVDPPKKDVLLQNSINEEVLLERVSEVILTISSKILSVDIQELDLDADKSDYGFDSISTTDFVNRLNATYSIDLTPPVVFEYATLRTFATYLSGAYGEDIARYHGMSGGHDEPEMQTSHTVSADETNENASEPVDVHRSNKEPIAIIGIGAHMPQSESMDQLWENLVSGKTFISEIPPERWDWHQYYGDPIKEVNKTNIKWGGFMKAIDQFDASFFGISPHEAGLMDPRQRIYLQTVWEAIEDAGYRPSDLSGSKTGMFVGVVSSDYYDLMHQAGIPTEAHTALGIFHSILANRISYLLNLHGPSEPVDTACSGSLVAIHRAVESIHNGECELAVAGGISVIASPQLMIAFNQAGMLSVDGRCKTFDQGADGYVRGEGSGALLLKPLSKAEADGDHIYGVIQATAINHGGHANTLTSPNPNAQAELIVEAWSRSGIDPRTADYIEAHGTGTPLGDPIEINALKKAFSQLVQNWDELHGTQSGSSPDSTVPHCAVGTIKTYIGHLEAAAGVAGVLNVLLSMKHNRLLPNLQLNEVNPYIQLKNSPFYIVKEGQTWNRKHDTLPRSAGVSSFGFGGVNAHIVIREYVTKHNSSQNISNRPQLLIVSAKNRDRLKAYAKRIVEFLSQTDGITLADVAFTMQTGREEMEERLALVSSSITDAVDMLERFVAGQADLYRCWQGSVSKRKSLQDEHVITYNHPSTDQDSMMEAELHKLAQLWVTGNRIDWSSMDKSEGQRKISIPTYPFAETRHWLPNPVNRIENAGAHRSGMDNRFMMKLENRSDFRSYRYEFEFTGQESFFRDHEINGYNVLPASAHIELIRAAVMMAAQPREDEQINLQKLVWLQPVVAQQGMGRLRILLNPSSNGDIEVTVQSPSESQGDGTETMVFSQGTAVITKRGVRKTSEVETILSSCNLENLTSEQCYSFFSARGMRYGPDFQGLKIVSVGHDQALARIALPSNIIDGFQEGTLHPGLLDNAFQATIGIWSSASGNIQEEPQDTSLLPFSIQQLQIFGSCEAEMWAHVRVRQESGSAVVHADTEYDMDLFNVEGDVRVSIRAMRFRRPEPKASNLNETKGMETYELQMLAPAWKEQTIGLHEHEHERVLNDLPGEICLVGTKSSYLTQLLKYLPHAEVIVLNPQDSIMRITEQLIPIMNLRHMVWISPLTTGNSPDVEGMIEAQEEGVFLLYRLIKALLQDGYGNRSMEWTVITMQANAIHTLDSVDPTHAGIHGLIGVLCKERPGWKVRQVDLDQLNDKNMHELFSWSADSYGFPYVNRHGEWFRQQLASVTYSPVSSGQSHSYRHGGVYVVIGGAGGIGEAWSEYMIQHYKAQIIWLGRRKLDADIQAKLQRLGELGPAPCYMAVDATDSEAMRQACTDIRRNHQTIHGFIHSAIVLEDRSLEYMDEAAFRKAYSTKVDISINIAKACIGESLDFVLFFSSMNSFLNSAGQANYVAGCTFKDVFAQFLRQCCNFPVKVMNWGYWGSVGSVRSEYYKTRMAKAGQGSIEAPEAMEALNVLMNGVLDQIALIRKQPLVDMQILHEEESIMVYQGAVPSLVV